jgi:hypothetical protein
MPTQTDAGWELLVTWMTAGAMSDARTFTSAGGAYECLGEIDLTSTLDFSAIPADLLAPARRPRRSAIL